MKAINYKYGNASSVLGEVTDELTPLVRSILKAAAPKVLEVINDIIDPIVVDSKRKWPIGNYALSTGANAGREGGQSRRKLRKILRIQENDFIYAAIINDAKSPPSAKFPAGFEYAYTVFEKHSALFINGVQKSKGVNVWSKLKEVEGVTAAEARKMVSEVKKGYALQVKAAKAAAEAQGTAAKSVSKGVKKETGKQIADVTELGQKALTELGGYR